VCEGVFVFGGGGVCVCVLLRGGVTEAAGDWKRLCISFEYGLSDGNCFSTRSMVWLPVCCDTCCHAVTARLCAVHPIALHDHPALQHCWRRPECTRPVTLSDSMAM
jgi:hypothetical protein